VEWIAAQPRRDIGAVAEDEIASDLRVMRAAIAGVQP
jgi:hypothetical protein